MELYNQGYSANQITKYFQDKDYKVSSVGICKILNKNHCIIGNDKFALTKEQQETILYLYNVEKRNITYIQKYLKFSNNRPISNFLKKNNIKIDTRRNSRTKQINEHYFDIIDSEFKAYILGYIIADGCIIKRGNCLSLTLDLKLSDKYILEMFSKELLGEIDNIYVNQKRQTCSVRYGSKGLCNSLQKYGVIPRKTGKEYLPFDKIPVQYRKDVIRGFFDGDGTVFLRTDNSKKYNQRLEFGFCGNHFILQQLKDILDLSDNKILDRQDRNISTLMFSKYRDILNFYHYIYDDSNYFLTRKKEKFDAFINLYDSTEVTVRKNSFMVT